EPVLSALTDGAPSIPRRARAATRQSAAAIGPIIAAPTAIGHDAPSAITISEHDRNRHEAPDGELTGDKVGMRTPCRAVRRRHPALCARTRLTGPRSSDQARRLRPAPPRPGRGPFSQAPGTSP